MGVNDTQAHTGSADARRCNSNVNLVTDELVGFLGGGLPDATLGVTLEYCELGHGCWSAAALV